LIGGAALAHGEKIDSVQYVSLSLSIRTDETIDACAQVKLGLGNILVIQYGEVSEYHLPIFSTQRYEKVRKNSEIIGK